MIVVNIAEKIAVVLLGAIMLVGCSFTTTRSDVPVFVMNKDSLSQRLVQIISAGHINVKGSAINTNGKINTELEVEITNGRGLPDDEDQLFVLGKSIASVLKKALKDENQFKNYKVKFSKKEKKGGLNLSTSTERVFKSDEL